MFTPNLLSDGRHDELRNFTRSVQANTGKLVHDGGVGEALHEGVAVLVNVDPGDLGQKRLDLVLHHLPDKLAVDGVVDDFVNVLESCELTGVTKSGVGAVKQTQLVHLELLDVVNILDNLDTNLFKGGTTVAELVLDNPLHERFGNNGPFVLDAKVLGKAFNVGLFGTGSDAVNHGVGESTLVGDPVGDFGVAKLGE